MTGYEIISLYILSVLVAGAHCKHQFTQCDIFILMSRIICGIIFVSTVIEWWFGTKIL